MVILHRSTCFLFFIHCTVDNIDTDVIDDERVRCSEGHWSVDFRY